VAISGLNDSARHRCEMDWLHQIMPSWAVQTESIPPIVHVVKHDVGMTETGVFTIENYLAVLSECSMGLRHWQLIAAADRHLPSRCVQASALPARRGSLCRRPLTAAHQVERKVLPAVNSCARRF
jgi:hypothetical protein